MFRRIILNFKCKYFDQNFVSKYFLEMNICKVTNCSDNNYLLCDAGVRHLKEKILEPRNSKESKKKNN